MVATFLSQSNVRHVNVTQEFNLVFILTFYSVISTWNIFILFGIIKYVKNGYSCNNKFTVSLEVNYDPKLRVGS